MLVIKYIQMHSKKRPPVRANWLRNDMKEAGDARAMEQMMHNEGKAKLMGARPLEKLSISP